MKIDEWIKQYRQDKGMSQQQFAKMVGCGISSVRSWEKREHEPSSKMFFRLVLLLGVPKELEYLHMKVSTHETKTGNKLAAVEFGDVDAYILEQWQKRHPEME